MAEAQQVAMLKRELELQAETELRKKQEQRTMMNKVFLENEARLKEKHQKEEKQRLADIQAQKAYLEILDQQEQDKINEFNNRVDKVKKNMDRMADNIIVKQQKRSNVEEQKIDTYVKQKQMEDMLEDQRRQKQYAQRQKEMRDVLKQQVKEREIRKQIDRDMLAEQAELWRQDREKFEKAERTQKDAFKRELDNNAAFLREQIHRKQAAEGMSHHEQMLNKELLNLAHDGKVENLDKHSQLI